VRYCFGASVTWRVGNVCGFGEEVGHALRWWIKIKSAAALLRNAAAGVGGLPLSLATIWLIDLPAC
jgi:hypothetical protein